MKFNLSLFKAKRNGATLIEVLIACGVFSLLVICLFAVIKYATNSWRSIEDRISVQSEMRKMQSSISEDLRRSSYSSVLVYNVATDYRKALAFATFMDPVTGKYDTDIAGNRIQHGFILFILLRPTTDPCTHPCGGTDYKCPHKILLRVDLTKKVPGGPLGDYANITDIDTLKNYIPSPQDKKHFKDTSVSVSEYISTITGPENYAGYVDNVYIVGKNVLSFFAEKQRPPDNPEILVDIKCFKLLETGPTFTIGSGDLDKSQFTIQVDSRIIPQNP